MKRMNGSDGDMRKRECGEKRRERERVSVRERGEDMMCMSGREREYKKVYLLPISVIERV